MKKALLCIVFCITLPVFAKDSEKKVTNDYSLASKFIMPITRSECSERTTSARAREEKARFRIGDLKTKATQLRSAHDSLTQLEDKNWRDLLAKLGATPQSYNLYIEDLEIERRAVSGYAALHGEDTSAWELALVSSEATIQTMQSQPIAMLSKSEKPLTTLMNTLNTSKEDLKTTKMQLLNTRSIQSIQNKIEEPKLIAIIAPPKSQPQATATKTTEPLKRVAQIEPTVESIPPKIEKAIIKDPPPPISEKVISVKSDPPALIVQSVIVAKGETLWAIADRVYGNKSRWADIYWANKPKLESPEALLEGMELAIPK